MAVVMDEERIENFEPTEKEISEYAVWLGMDLEEDKELLWIARDGLLAPLPKPWKPCQTGDDGEIFYFNFETGESVWDHPCDDRYRRLYSIEHKKKKGETLSKDDKKYLQDIGRDDLIPSKIGTLVATLNDQGDVEVSVLSMGGNAFACAKLKHADGSQYFRSVQKALNKQVGEPLHLILPDGRMLEKDDGKKLVREVIQLSNTETWPTTPPAKKEKHTKKSSDEAEKVRESPRKITELIELPPLKITKKRGYRHFGAKAQNATDWTVV